MRSDRMLAWIPGDGLDGALSRRRFLTSVGLLAGAAALAPVLRHVTRREATRVDETRPGLGTWIRVVARHPEPDVASRAVRRAFAAVDHVDREMSLHRADSDLTRINRAAGSHVVAVPASILQVVALALDAARRTGGLYDPTIVPLMKLYGFYGGSTSRFPSDREIATALERVDYRHVALDRERGTIGLGTSGASLDLGSIGKGWAVDRAAQALRESGIRHGMVDAGGNIAAFGSARDGAEGWTVGVLHPVSRGIDRTFTLKDEAIATSGNYEQFRVLDHVRVGHLFDARRGRPAAGHLSTTVRAKTGVQADLMSTASFLLGPDRFHWPEALELHTIG